MPSAGTFRRSLFAFVLTAAFIATFALTHRLSAAAATFTQPVFESMPMTLDEWEGQTAAPLDPESAKILAADQYLHRYYVAPAGVVEIDVAYYTQRRVGASMHSPLNCLPGNGWTVSDSRTLRVQSSRGPQEIRELTVRRNRVMFALAYWYQSRHQVLTGELATRFKLLSESLQSKPADVGLVRVMARLQTEDAPERAAVASFATLLIPELERAWER